MKTRILPLTITCVLLCTSPVLGDLFPKFSISGEDATEKVFGSKDKEIFPVAYGDFNADKLTDVIAVSNDQSAIELYFASEEAPYLRLSQSCPIRRIKDSKYKPVKIIGATPGDFTGDGLMDLMVTILLASKSPVPMVEVFIYQGNATNLKCDNRSLHEITNHDFLMAQEPTVVDLNGDMVLDLVGERLDVRECYKNPNETCNPIRERYIWLFSKDDPLKFTTFKFNIVSSHYGSLEDDEEEIMYPMINPSSNAFVDVDGDLVPELVLTTVGTDSHPGMRPLFIETYVVETEKISGNIVFRLASKELLDPKNNTQVVGQSVFLDLNQDGNLVHMVPFFTAKKPSAGTNGIKAQLPNGTMVDLPLLNKSYKGKRWSFYHPENEYHTLELDFYSKYLSLRVGDYNLDGYPDLIAAMNDNEQELTSDKRSVIFENVPCVVKENSPCPFPRTFKLNFEAMAQYSGVVVATFFDIKEDGLIDVLLVRKANNDTHPGKGKYTINAFQNSPDYDANFMKVMVLTGRPCPKCPNTGDIPYGNLIPGPVIKYQTTTQAGLKQTAVAAQMYRSAHMPMDLPYTIFGIGHSPNFVEVLKISVSPRKDDVREHGWPQIIPNSQIIVIPSPAEQPKFWKAKLFLTPSRAVLNTFGVLVAFCLFVSALVILLQVKERREDRLERTQETYPFHLG